ncbi:hypothetical protein PVAND_012991 [Polypedilum vanderplanki]|uniref:Protein-lysine N-methyltransferase PVAND_012991 n=1 Tax=Polypedilum vanderplanki TaxID=319348 RepID=A0A9J6CQ43_POLVA|nr:hypothetical protein PVAND_012991 [Polypedilum vanderplanki]
MEEEDTINLNPCELGTKSYWDSAYETEIKNYLDNGDIGEIWFDESSQTRIIKWLNKQDTSKDASIIDLGTGNGAMLFELSEAEYTNLTGVDYSEKSIELAQKIAIDQDQPHITFKVCDLLADVTELGRFDVCHDKGTFDAIGLMNDAFDKKEIYTKNVFDLLNDKGLFIITSCNFTELELTKSFSNYFDKFEVIPSQTFQFGGKVGKTTTSICFKKKETLSK